MSAAELFNQRLELGEPLASLWEKGRDFGPHSPRFSMRYLKRAGGILLREHTVGSLIAGKEQFNVVRAEGHLQKLQDFRMPVVTHVSELSSAGLALPEPGQVSEDAVLGHSASRYLVRLLPLVHPKTRDAVTKQQVRDSIVYPLLQYYEWCADTDQESFLSDVNTPNQYGLARSVGIVGLHDIGPIMRRVEGGVLEQYSRELEENFEFILD